MGFGSEGVNENVVTGSSICRVCVFLGWDERKKRPGGEATVFL